MIVELFNPISVILKAIRYKVFIVNMVLKLVKLDSIFI